MTFADFVGLGSVVAAASGVYVGYKAMRIAEATAKIANNAMTSAESVAALQRMLTQRQFLIPLWTYMTSVNALDTKNPNIKDVLNAVHTLELVALCVEGGMVDEAIIKRTFRDAFLQLYDQVESCPYMDRLKKDGKTLVRENKAAMAFHDRLLQEHREQDKPAPLEGGPSKKQLTEGKK